MATETAKQRRAREDRSVIRAELMMAGVAEFHAKALTHPSVPAMLVNAAVYAVRAAREKEATSWATTQPVTSVRAERRACAALADPDRWPTHLRPAAEAIHGAILARGEAALPSPVETELREAQQRLRAGGGGR